MDDITPSMLEGFFEGWLKPPSLQKHLKVLKNSYAVIVAIDDSNGKVVGFISAISDSLCAYIPMLEVLSEYRRKGIEKQLLGQMLAKLNKMIPWIFCVTRNYSHSTLPAAWYLLWE